MKGNGQVCLQATVQQVRARQGFCCPRFFQVPQASGGRRLRAGAPIDDGAQPGRRRPGLGQPARRGTPTPTAVRRVRRRPARRQLPPRSSAPWPKRWRRLSPATPSYLATPGGTGTGEADYVGNWTVSTSGTSASTPLTIEPASGVADPTLDGNGGSSSSPCSTSACNGPLLTVSNSTFVDIDGVTFQNADNTSAAPYGGAIQNDAGGTLDGGQLHALPTTRRLTAGPSPTVTPALAPSP